MAKNKKTKMTTVFTNGCFDVLHVGHFNLLLYCAKLAGPDGQIIVGLDSDEKIKKDKGINRPFYTQNERMTTLMSLDLPIKEIRIFDTNEQLLEIVKIFKPTYIVKGEDWKGNVVGSEVSEVKLFHLTPNQSTSDISRRIVQKSLEYDFRNEIIDPFERP